MNLCQISNSLLPSKSKAGFKADWAPDSWTTYGRNSEDIANSGETHNKSSVFRNRFLVTDSESRVKPGYSHHRWDGV